MKWAIDNFRSFSFTFLSIPFQEQGEDQYKFLNTKCVWVCACVHERMFVCVCAVTAAAFQTHAVNTHFTHIISKRQLEMPTYIAAFDGYRLPLNVLQYIAFCGVMTHVHTIQTMLKHPFLIDTHSHHHPINKWHLPPISKKHLSNLQDYQRHISIGLTLNDIWHKWRLTSKLYVA